MQYQQSNTVISDADVSGERRYWALPKEPKAYGEDYIRPCLVFFSIFEFEHLLCLSFANVKWISGMNINYNSLGVILLCFSISSSYNKSDLPLEIMTHKVWSTIECSRQGNREPKRAVIRCRILIIKDREPWEAIMRQRMWYTWRCVLFEGVYRKCSALFSFEMSTGDG